MDLIKVALVENLEAAHRMYRRILEQTSGVQLIAAFHYPEELIEKLEEGIGVDVIVMDNRMNELDKNTGPERLDGIAAAQLIRQRHPRMPIVLYSNWDEPEFYRRVEMAHFGSHYAIVKRYALDTNRLGEIIRSVVRGFAYIDPEVRVEMDLLRAWSEHSPLRLLETEEQYKILALISDGLSNEEVARTIGIRPRRVEEEIKSIYELLGLSNEGTGDSRRIRAARMYLEDRILEWDVLSDGRVILLAQNRRGEWRPLNEVKQEEARDREDAKKVVNAFT